jgi:tetratricopeptide (TPR) repeat protein
MKRSEFAAAFERGDISSAIRIACSSEKDRESFFVVLGDHFLKTGNLNAAKRFYFESMSLKPNPDAEFGFGSALLEEGKPAEAIPFLSSSARHKDYEIQSLLKLGVASRLVGNIRQALYFYIDAKAKGYGEFVVDFNIATLLCDLGEFDKAAEYYERGMRAAPKSEQAKFNYSMFIMSRGDFAKGLEHYESRPWCFKGNGSPWSGQSGESVLVLAEQGHGDLINFARFLPALKSISKKVSLACDPNVSRFVSSVGGLDEVFDLSPVSIEKASKEYPFYCRAMSIPFLMGIDVTKFPSDPYLKYDKERADFWEKILSEDADGLRVGLCWQGGKRNDPEMVFNDKKRSVDLGLMESLLNVEGVNFYSLQKDWNEHHPRIKYHMDKCGDFMDTASLISRLDLVISVDTSIAHVAGAIGKPVWMMARLGGCWRWTNEGERTFWYPSMKVFRQSSVDAWDSVVSRISRELSNLVSSGG